MSHSHTKIWIHAVFSTKERQPLINSALESKLYHHIKSNLEKDFSCQVKSINGMNEHIHILFMLNPNYTVVGLIKNIKGESSHWINSNKFLNNKFAWQTGYGAFSVSESKLKDVEKYIESQKEHHKKITFIEEYEKFMKTYGFH